MSTSTSRAQEGGDQHAAAASAPAIAARSLTKSFRTRSGALRPALSDVDLEIREGEFVALLGPSGCGKTTLLRLIGGLEEPTDGCLELFGEPIIGPTTASSMVFQGSVLLPWKTILRNVLLPAEIRKYRMRDWEDRARELLERTGLGAFADHYPRELSGGMRQRAAICRALLLDPPVLLMDEPFGALDAITRTKMNEDLLGLWIETGKTVVFVTHDISEAARLAQTVLLMSPSPGRVSRRMDLGHSKRSYRDRTQSAEYSDQIRELEILVHQITTGKENKR